MSKEATVQGGLTIRILGTGNVTLQEYQAKPSSFTADVSMAGGPTPGEVLVALLGTDISLTQLTQPGLCRIMNLGVSSTGTSLFGTAGAQYSWTNYVEVGVYVPSITDFVPLLELLPGESYTVRLSRFVGSSFNGTAAGTATSETGLTFRMRAIGTACKCLIEVFER
jgi:hypothetical protein